MNDNSVSKEIESKTATYKALIYITAGLFAANLIALGLISSIWESYKSFWPFLVSIALCIFSFTLTASAQKNDLMRLIAESNGATIGPPSKIGASVAVLSFSLLVLLFGVFQIFANGSVPSA